VAREADLTLLPPNLDPRLVELLQRCLEKSPRRRWQTATDLRADLEAIARGRRSSAALAPVAVQASSRRHVALVSAASVVAAAALTLGAVWLFRTEPAPGPRVPTTRFSLPLPEGQQFTNPGRHLLTISPDGSTIVYVANSQLYLRRMSELEPRPIPGTDGWNSVTEPVFSPDGLWVAFFAQRDGTIKKIGVAGGIAITLCRAANPQGMSWGADGLVFGNPGGILRVSPNGGEPQLLVPVNAGEVAHGPQVVSGGEAVLFTLAKGISTDLWDQAQIVVQTIPSGERRVVINGGSDARYLPTGHLVYVTDGVVFAQRVDLLQGPFDGSGTPVIEGVLRPPRIAVIGSTGTAHFSVSATGSLVYLPGPTRTGGSRRDLAQVTRSGNVAPLKLPPGSYLNPRYAPDGARIAFDLSEGKDATIGVYDLSGATALRSLTLTGASRFPTWSADSTRVTYQSDREGDLGIFWQRADGSGAAERLTKAEPGTSHVPDSWSPDGRTLLFETLKDGVFSLWTLSWPERKVERFGDIESREAIDAVFAPDGRWVAYDAGEGSDTRIYVEPFPRTGARYRATNERGINPFWSPSGTELIYAPSGETFAAVAFATRPSVGFGNPVPVPRGVLTGTTAGVRRTYDISPDGRHIVGIIDTSATAQEGRQPAIQVVLGWFDELRARVP
jgi:serine/threonine-protein kinase